MNKQNYNNHIYNGSNINIVLRIYFTVLKRLFVAIFLKDYSIFISVQFAKYLFMNILKILTYYVLYISLYSLYSLYSYNISLPVIYFVCQ